MSHDIQLIVFDMGHVFIDFEWEAVCQGFCTRAGISQEQFQLVLKHIGSLGYEHGHIETADFIAAINEQMVAYGNANPITDKEFHALWNATFRENLAMAQLMQSLKRRCKLYLLSNTNEAHWQFIDNSYQVNRHFDELILSFEIGHVKPKHDIYHEVLKRSKLSAEQCVFIDDLPQNVAAASEVGMNVVHFQGIDDLVARLQAMGVMTE